MLEVGIRLRAHEEESALSNTTSCLDSSSASRVSSLASRFKRFSLASEAILSLSVSCSMSYTGRQFNNCFAEACGQANKRHQCVKVETNSELVSGLEAGELDDDFIAVVGGE